MALPAPQHAEEIERAKQDRRRARIENTHGAVWPDGRVTEHFVEPPASGPIGRQAGDCPVLWINGKPDVVDRHRKKGVRLLKEVCEADGVPELYERWREAIRARDLKSVQIRNPEALYPPTVHRLRANHASDSANGQVFDAATGTMVDATEEARSRRVAALAESAGLGTPTREDRGKAK